MSYDYVPLEWTKTHHKDKTKKALVVGFVTSLVLVGMFLSKGHKE